MPLMIDLQPQTLTKDLPLQIINLLRDARDEFIYGLTLPVIYFLLLLQGSAL
jgi:hypothetical protein